MDGPVSFACFLSPLLPPAMCYSEKDQWMCVTIASQQCYMSAVHPFSPKDRYERGWERMRYTGGDGKAAAENIK